MGLFPPIPVNSHENFCQHWQEQTKKNITQMMETTMKDTWVSSSESTPAQSEQMAVGKSDHDWRSWSWDKKMMVGDKVCKDKIKRKEEMSHKSRDRWRWGVNERVTNEREEVSKQNKSEEERWPLITRKTGQETRKLTTGKTNNRSANETRKSRSKMRKDDEERREGWRRTSKPKTRDRNRDRNRNRDNMSFS